MTGNGIFNLLCERSRERNFKCTIRATHAHTWNYVWDEDYKTAEITSDDNDTILDTYDDQFEVEIYQNHNYVEILRFGLGYAPYPSSNNEWEEFAGDNDFDMIMASTDPC